MNTQSNAVPGFDPMPAPATETATRPLYWSIRRELWENRAVYIAPMAVASVFLFAFMISTVHLAQKMRAAFALDAIHQREVIEQPYNFAALLLMGTYLIVAAFYCLDALYGERRDRSILFWKSLPVSDLTAVLSKASIPLVILPLLTFAITLVTQWIMLLLSTAVLAGSGMSPAPLWTQLPMFQMSLGLFNHLIGVHALYYAPIYGWLLLVSAWARRAPFVWAALPLFVIGIVEKIAFNTTHFAHMLALRLSGGAESIPFPVSNGAMHPAHSASVPFLLSPGLWIGFFLCALFLAGAVRLRRSQGPI